MKTLILFLTTVVTAVLVAVAISTPVLSHTAYAQNTKTDTAATDYRQYSNSTLGIKMQVPADWLYKEINNTAVTFVSAPNSTNKAAVVVSVQTIPKDMSLGLFSQGNLKDLQQNTPSFHLITSNSTSLSGNPAHQILFTAPSATGSHDIRKGLSLWTLKDGKAYIITYRAEPGLGSFTTQLPIVSYMIKSFQIS